MNPFSLRLPAGFADAEANARRVLLAERNERGHWTGELSTSALSTATSIVALGCVDEVAHREPVRRAVTWLTRHQNEDGGWGDTTRSFSNISTTLLCWSALCRFGGDAESTKEARRKASHWIRDYCGSLAPALLAETVKARYGKDRTFSVPILMLCAICGTLGENGWRRVLPLPFELAALPRHWFAILRLPVVSYALPALIAIGHARFRLAPPPPWSPLRWIRGAVWPRVSRLLERIQPESGGFLEAAPLTGFVTMALAVAGQPHHPVARRGVRFLLETVRSDGSWPIDTNLATWASTLAVKALTHGHVRDDAPGFDGADRVRDWLLAQQYREVHPFTDSPPGGWAWTDLSGGVPDADDTPGALLALHRIGRGESFDACRDAARRGTRWLLDLQNRDGGIPTFCRGWGALPFDRSSPDLTAHTIRAWTAWHPHLGAEDAARVDAAIDAALHFLEKTQNPDGSWTPLWFGNQHRRRDEANPVYGTAQVLLALNAIEDTGASIVRMRTNGADALASYQNADGGWGSARNTTPSTIEETALAVAALATSRRFPEPCQRGIEWLITATRGGTAFPASPIGFYFAKLWYFERLYPHVWTVEAFARARCAAEK